MIRKTKTSCIVMNGGYDYEIEWDRLDIPTKLVGWVRHLTTKRWMDRAKIRLFIEFVADHHQWDVDTL